MYITEHERADGAEWVDAAQAVAIAKSARSEPNVANTWQFLIRRAGADLILTRANYMRVNGGGAPAIERGNVLIAYELWHALDKSKAIKTTDWRCGDFEFFRYDSRSDHGSGSDIAVFGVQFSKQDLLAQLPAPGAAAMPHPVLKATQATRPRNGNGGRTPSKKAWEQFAAALAVVAASDDVGLEVGTSAASVYEKVCAVLAARAKTDEAGFGLDNVTDAITLAIDWASKGMPD